MTYNVFSGTLKPCSLTHANNSAVENWTTQKTSVPTKFSRQNYGRNRVFNKQMSQN